PIDDGVCGNLVRISGKLSPFGLRLTPLHLIARTLGCMPCRTGRSPSKMARRLAAVISALHSAVQMRRIFLLMIISTLRVGPVGSALFVWEMIWRRFRVDWII